MPSEKRRVLCAEPHEDTCLLIKTMLGGQGHEVVSAQTIHDCLELARRERFDLYMLDDDYVDGNSIDLCRELRALTPETPILFFSSLALPRDRQRALVAGALAYLTKPDGLFDIVSTINAILLPRSSRHTSSERE